MEFHDPSAGLDVLTQRVHGYLLPPPWPIDSAANMRVAIPADDFNEEFIFYVQRQSFFAYFP